MENKCYVYRHKFPNGKLYFGITTQKAEKRWGHGCNYSANERLSNAIKKYGWENIEHEILFEFDSIELAEQKEIELIKQHKTNERAYGYNVALGGKGAYGYKHTEEAKQKISARAKMKRKPLTKEHIAKIVQNKTGANNPNFGKPRSEETRRKIGEAQKGKIKTEEELKNYYGKQKNTIYIEYQGERLTIRQWSKKTGILGCTILYRYKSGMPLEKIFSKEKLTKNG